MSATRTGTNLLDYWAILVRRRWVIYLSVLSVSVLALIGSFVATPLYRATVTMQIERQSPDVLTFRDLSKVDHSWAAYSDFYQTQYKIIASPAVARDAVEKLGLDAQKLFDISSKASGSCWAMLNHNPVPGLVETSAANRDYQPGFAAAMMHKDLKLSQEAASQAGAATPLGAFP